MKCTDVSILTKILGSNGISLFLLASLAGFIWFSLGILNQESDNAHYFSTLQKDLITRENEHLRWAQKVADFVSNPSIKTLEVQTDNKLCAFGTWYYGEGRKDVEKKFPDLGETLSKLDAPHQTLHASAKKIAALKEAGDLVDAQELFNTEVRTNLQTISELFSTIRTRLGVQEQETNSQFDSQLKFIHRALVLTGSVTILLGIIISVLLAKSITRPIKELVSFSSDIANGNTKAKLNIDCQNEIGQLAHSLRETVKHMNDQLAYSRGILNGLTVPCSVFSNDDITVFTNQRMLDLIERDGRPEDYYGQKSGLYIWEDANRETISTTALREQRLITADREITTRKGNGIHARISSAPFRNEEGEILGTLSIWIDMTEIVQKNAMVEEQNKAILEVAGKLRDVVGVVSSASEELSAQVEQSSQGAQIQAQRIAETAIAMEEMTATVVEVAHNASEAASTTEQARKQAQRGADVVNAVVQGIQAVQTQALGLKEEMSSLGNQADGIGRIINVISDIADQTNLLALNAAIEAARAGDAGRGFAVVADEVRKLAEKTMAATQEVDTAIREIQQGTQKNVDHVDKAVESIEATTHLATDSGSALHEIVRLVDVASDQVRAIATASEEQSATSEEINRSVDDVNRVATETAQAMEQSSQAVIELARQALILNKLAQTMKTDSV